MKPEFKTFGKFLSRKKVDWKRVEILPDYDYDCLEWSSEYWKNRVYTGDILHDDENLFAFQEEKINLRNENEKEYFLVIVESEKEIFRWKLVQIDRDENEFSNLYLGIHKGNIIHIHKHELHISILSYKNEVIKRFHFWGELINRQGNVIAFERIQKKDKERPVELIEIPELIKLNSISIKESEMQNIRPQGNFPKNFLNKK